MIEKIEPETKDEILAVNALLQEMREKKRQEELLQKHKIEISFAIAQTIGDFGIEETKHLVRELLRELCVL